MNTVDPNKDYTVEELLAITEQWLDELHEGDAAAFDERLAIQREALFDGLSTDQRAIAALKRPERFRGEHGAARAWLGSSKTARIWGRLDNTF